MSFEKLYEILTEYGLIYKEQYQSFVLYDKDFTREGDEICDVFPAVCVNFYTNPEVSVINKIYLEPSSNKTFEYEVINGVEDIILSEQTVREIMDEFFIKLKNCKKEIIRTKIKRIAQND